ncbi:MAG: hypothetical protein ACHQE6_06805, partial [Solirubrobacterales bacterium]
MGGFASHGGFSTPRALVLVCAIALLGARPFAATAAGAAGRKPTAAKRLTAANWDLSAQRLVVSDAVMGELGGAGFAGAGALSAQAESSALAAMAAGGGAAPNGLQTQIPRTPVGVDARLVGQPG